MGFKSFPVKIQEKSVRRKIAAPSIAKNRIRWLEICFFN